MLGEEIISGAKKAQSAIRLLVKLENKYFLRVSFTHAKKMLAQILTKSPLFCEENERNREDNFGNIQESY